MIPAVPFIPVSSNSVTAATAPMINCPSPPRLNTPHLYAKAAASEVNISGHVSASVCASMELLPNAPINSAAYAVNGFVPSSAMMIPPTRNANSTAISGMINPSIFFMPSHLFLSLPSISCQSEDLFPGMFP